MRKLFLGLTAVALTSGIAHAEDPMMSLDQMKSEIIGNSLSGTSPTGDAFVEHYTPDGKIIGMSKGAKYEAAWRFRNDGLMCFKYGEGAFEGGCVHLSRSGDQVTFVRMDGTKELTATLIPGTAPELK